MLLFGRELRVRYKQTALGVLWVLLLPLVPAVIFAVVLGTFARLPSSGTPYLLFAFSGLVIFGLFSNAASRGAASFLRDGNLVTKVYVPRAILPIAAGTGAVVDFAVGVALLLVIMVAFGSVPPLAIAAVPLIAAATLILGLGLGMALAALSAHYRDFAIVVPFVLQVLMYASPIVYSAELVPGPVQALYSLNPLVALTNAFRWAMLGTAPPTGPEVVLALAVGLILTVLGAAVFSRGSRDLTDVL